jgi:radical SAM protein with 4Fe4S-binding SPASM domain
MEYQIYTTTKCNLACIYCHEKLRVNRPPYQTFDEQRIKELYRKIHEYQRAIKDYKIHFNWTGGEPLTLPLSQIRRFIALQRKIFPKRYHVKNSFQTNLYSLSDRYLDWLKRHRKSIELGVSLDFTERPRLTKSGAPSQGRVFKNLQRLNNAGIHFEILCVVSKYNIDRMEDIYDYAIENNIDFHFIPLNRAPDKTLKKHIIDPLAYAKSLLPIIEKYVLDTKTKIIFSNATSYSSVVLKGSMSGHCCEIAGDSCGRDFISIHPNGKVFVCTCLSFDEYSLGNVFQQSLKNILSTSNPSIKLYRERNHQLSKGECASCRWNKICKGACPYDSIVKGNPFKKNRHRCIINKFLFPKLTTFYQKLGYETRFK